MALPLPYLTIADWQRARSCPIKVHYGKRGYAQTGGVSAYAKMLGEGRYILHKLAQLRFPEGETVLAPTLDEGLRATAAALARTPVTLFEPVLVAGNGLVRPDILEMRPEGAVLWEVRSKAYNSQGARPFATNGETSAALGDPPSKAWPFSDGWGGCMDLGPLAAGCWCPIAIAPVRWIA
ncbi:MAG: hypothetical protein HC918_12555 [Oscillatoriales cyanobacterium SM2_1_8]|nr:hypothetical protein [Oscillatoriales cyanobacterium SM2_1_8]